MKSLSRFIIRPIAFSNLTSRSIYLIPVALLLLCVQWTKVSSDGSIGCFVCTSINGSNPKCEDTFNASVEMYRSNCMSGRKGRTGVFQANSCIKMKLRDPDIEKYTVVVRDCVVDNGGVNSESEIGRESHCGWVGLIRYNNNLMKGCLETCSTDGCNAAAALMPIISSSKLQQALSVLLAWFLT